MDMINKYVYLSYFDNVALAKIVDVIQGQFYEDYRILVYDSKGNPKGVASYEEHLPAWSLRIIPKDELDIIIKEFNPTTRMLYHE